MIKVRPFPAYVVTPSEASKVVAPCIDAIGAAKLCEILDQNPDSFLHVIRSSFSHVIGEHSPRDWQARRRLMQQNFDSFQRLLKMEKYHYYKQPAFYIYQLQTPYHKQTGVVCSLDLDDCVDPNVLTHERTNRQHENRLLDYMTNVGTAATPVAMIWRENDQITQALKDLSTRDSDVQWQQDNLTQRLWRIDDQADIDLITRYFSKVKSLYLVDGHHRLSCGERFRKEVVGTQVQNTNDVNTDNEVLCVLFPESEMCILPYYHLLHDITDSELESLLLPREGLVINEVGCQDYDKNKNVGCVFARGRCYSFDFSARNQNGSSGHENEAENLWISQIYRKCLRPSLGIEREDQRINYKPGCFNMSELIDQMGPDSQTVALLPPCVLSDQVCAVAEQRGTMPPKSTWFEPKVCTGIFVRSYSTFGSIATKPSV